MTSTTLPSTGYRMGFAGFVGALFGFIAAALIGVLLFIFALPFASGFVASVFTGSPYHEMQRSVQQR